MTKLVLLTGDFFEIREIVRKSDGVKKAAKIYRKIELKSGASKKQSDDARILVERELKLFSKIDHPNVIKILEAYEDQFKIYFILDMP